MNLKTDRFVKVMLVIIAGLLLLNCFNSGSDVFPPPANASVPTFLEVGKTYKCSNLGGLPLPYKVTKIDKNSGWIEANGTNWVNMAVLYSCEEVKTQ